MPKDPKRLRKPAKPDLAEQLRANLRRRKAQARARAAASGTGGKSAADNADNRDKTRDS